MPERLAAALGVLWRIVVANAAAQLVAIGYGYALDLERASALVGGYCAVIGFLLITQRRTPAVEFHAAKVQPPVPPAPITSASASGSANCRSPSPAR